MKPYIKRNSESNEIPKLVEYLQNGILVHFDIKQEERAGMNEQNSTVFQYVEFWFDLEEPNLAAIVQEHGFELTEEYLKLI